MSDERDRQSGHKSERWHPLRAALDTALSVQIGAVEKQIARARQRNPDASPADVVRTLEGMYRAALTGTGAAVGAAAAAPGTGVAIAMSGGEMLTTLELSALFALSVAEVHGVRVDELERRRALVLGIMLGGSGSGSATTGKIAERTGNHWAKLIIESVPVTTLRQINHVLGRNFVTKYGTKQGIVVLGKVVPFGVGAAIGGGANLALAEGSIRSARRAFGPAPRAWPAPASRDFRGADERSEKGMEL